TNLVQGGIFAHSRNPLYLGNALVFLGLLSILDSVPGFVIGVPFFVRAYWAIVQAEEDYLGRQFGLEYAEYCRRVNRFLPSLRGLGTTIRSMQFDWRRVIRKEYGSTFYWITCMFALFVLQAWRQDGRESGLRTARALACVWLFAAVGYSIARFLKKTKRLGRD